MLILNDTLTQYIVDRASDGCRSFSLVVDKYSNATARVYLQDEFGDHLHPEDNLVVYDSDGTQLPVVENSYFLNWMETYTVHALGSKHTFSGTRCFRIETIETEAGKKCQITSLV